MERAKKDKKIKKRNIKSRKHTSKRKKKIKSSKHQKRYNEYLIKRLDILKELKKNRAEKKSNKVWELFKFILKFNIFLIPIYLISFYRLNLIALERLVARCVTGLLIITHVPSYNYDTFIKVLIPEGSFGAFISWDCTGWKSIIVFLALLYATPSSKEKKIFGLAFVPVIFFVNIIRIWFMFRFVHQYGVKYFQFIHQTLWSYGMIFTILLLWIIWFKNSKNYDKKLEIKNKQI